MADGAVSDDCSAMPSRRWAYHRLMRQMSEVAIHRRENAARPLQVAATLAWAVVSSSGGLLAFLPAAVTGTWVSDIAGGGDPVRLGAAGAVWTLLTATLTVGFARFLLRDIRSGMVPLAALLIVSGAAATAIAEAGLIIWTVEHYAYPDPEYMGWSVLLPVGMAALTSAGAASLVTVGLARAIAWLGTSATLLGLALLALDSAPGAFDGVSESGWALGLAFAASGAYSALVVAVLVRVRWMTGD